MAWSHVVSRRLIRACLLIALAAACVVARPAFASAGIGDPNTTTAAANGATGGITATAARESTGGRSVTGASPSRPRCTWEIYTDLQIATDPSGGPVPPV